MAFLAVYLPGSALVRYWTRDDLQLMEGLGRRLGAPGRVLLRLLAVVRPATAEVASR